MTSTRISTLLSATILAIGFALPASAQSVTDNLPVLANVINVCTLAIGAPVDFGTYDTAAPGADDAFGRLDVTCTQGADITGIALDNGANGTRLMRSGASLLDYELYSDAPGGLVWGSVNPPPAPTNATRQFTVYGRIPAGQSVPAGAYTDTVVVTVTW